MDNERAIVIGASAITAIGLVTLALVESKRNNRKIGWLVVCEIAIVVFVVAALVQVLVQNG